MFLLVKGFQSIEFPKQSIECDSYFCYNRNKLRLLQLKTLTGSN